MILTAAYILSATTNPLKQIQQKKLKQKHKHKQNLSTRWWRTLFANKLHPDRRIISLVPLLFGMVFARGKGARTPISLVNNNNNDNFPRDSNDGLKPQNLIRF